MLTVRFPTGVAITYNNATKLYYNDDRWVLFTDDKEKGGQWVCSIQKGAGAIVEAIHACAVENPAANPTGNGAVDLLIGNIRSVTSWSLKRLKVALRDFNARTMSWKD